VSCPGGNRASLLVTPVNGRQDAHQPHRQRFLVLCFGACKIPDFAFIPRSAASFVIAPLVPGFRRWT
jgi:hypothetical protein